MLTRRLERELKRMPTRLRVYVPMTGSGPEHLKESDAESLVN